VRAWVVFVLATACSAPVDPVTFDPCALTISAPDATAAQLAGIDAALASWRAFDVHVTRVDTAGDVSIAFRDDPAAIEYGLYDDQAGAIYVNTSVTDPAALAVTIAHELGHAVGLVHIAPATRASVMNPGNLSIAPTSADAVAVTARWGNCP
jgi:hypothetical protein